ncbi:MAG: nucleoside deaminase [Ruminococcaceae bacterium]|nr:nucleoside deaminase [Oscillospiraceae bacterium]
MTNDIFFMERALELAKKAGEMGEIPVGAVLIKDGEIIAEAHNLRESAHSATAHAELLAIESACAVLGTWRLSDCTLYVTMEPCPMCAGALVNSRIERVVFGCKDAAAGCCGSVLNFNSYPFNHAFDITGGVLAEESRELLQKFFQNKRETAKSAVKDS